MKYVVTKGDQREEFDSWRELCNECREWTDSDGNMGDVLYELYLESEADGRSGLEFSEWIYEDSVYGPWMIEALEECGWKVERVK